MNCGTSTRSACSSTGFEERPSVGYSNRLLERIFGAGIYIERETEIFSSESGYTYTYIYIYIYIYILLLFICGFLFTSAAIGMIMGPYMEWVLPP